MALYLGSSDKLKINLNNSNYILNIVTVKNELNFSKLLSSDNYILKDFDGLYLIVKEDK